MKRPPNRILELRTERGLSEQALADRLGWEKSKVHRLEAGKTDMRLPDMRLLGRVLGVKPSELLIDEDVEYRAGEADALVKTALAQVAADDRELFLNVCIDLSRIVRRTGTKRGSFALAGNA